MKILGIDPGTRNCGYAIVEKNGRDIKLIEAGLIKEKIIFQTEEDLNRKDFKGVVHSNPFL